MAIKQRNSEGGETAASAAAASNIKHHRGAINLSGISSSVAPRKHQSGENESSRKPAA